MNLIEQKATVYVNSRKVHVSGYTVDKDSGAIVTVSGFVDGSRRWTVSVTPEGTECDCPFGKAHGVTAQPHSHDTALRLAAWQMERINEQ